jgi:hypothetical protein
VLKCDRELPAESQTVFEIKYLTYDEQVRIEDATVTARVSSKDEEAREMNFRSGSVERMTIHAGLVGWRNFKDANGEDVRFERRGNQVKNECLDRLHPDWRTELCNAITDMNTVTEGERKN